MYLEVRALYGAKLRTALVELRVEETRLQMTPNKAREIASMLINGAETAEQDEFLVQWVKEKLGGNDEMAVQVLDEYRKYRLVMSAQQKVHDEGA